MGVAVLTGVAAALSGSSLATAASSAKVDPAARTVVTGGLQSAYGLDTLGRHRLVVADSKAGKVYAIGPRGNKSVLVSGALGVSGVAVKGKYLYSVLGGGDETGAIPPGGKYRPTSLLRTNLRSGKTRVVANLLNYEKKHNPDGQVQNYTPPPGQDKDALSNPFALGVYPRGILIADGGANDVLRFNPRSGRLSTFYVPPTVKQSGCQQANPGTTGCDPVPTGVTFAHHSVWVSTLGADTPGAGRIYKLSKRGHVQRVWTGLDSPTGIAVTRQKTIYYSQVFGGFTGDTSNPSSIGRVVRIKRGHVAMANVTLPTGLTLRGGQLFSTQWGAASDIGIPHEAQVVELYGGDFH